MVGSGRIVAPALMSLHASGPTGMSSDLQSIYLGALDNEALQKRERAGNDTWGEGERRVAGDGEEDHALFRLSSRPRLIRRPSLSTP